MSYKVVINTPSLNSFGSRVLTSGIDLSQFKRNPVLLWMHNRPWRGTADEVLPIGTVQDLEVKDEILTGVLKFDENDPFAKRIKEKWDAGVLRMVSMGIDAIELSDDPAHLVSGQTRMTVTRSKLREVSVVDMGSNDDALALYYEDKRLNLASGEIEHILKPIKPILNMNQIAVKLGLQPNASTDDVLRAIETLQARADEGMELKKEKQKLEDALLLQLVDTAVRNRQINAEQREHFMGIGKASGIEVLSKTLNMMSPAVKPTEIIVGAPASALKKFKDLSMTERIEMRANDPERYKALFVEEYGFDPKL